MREVVRKRIFLGRMIERKLTMCHWLGGLMRLARCQIGPRNAGIYFVSVVDHALTR